MLPSSRGAATGGRAASHSALAGWYSRSFTRRRAAASAAAGAAALAAWRFGGQFSAGGPPEALTVPMAPMEGMDRAAGAEVPDVPPTCPIEVAAYYFPNFHPDPRNDVWYGPGWTEWELVRIAEPRFPGHRQPIVPAWGYFDESDPEWTAREIDLAADHGVTAFLYDWYWYEDGPYLQDALERGFFGAPNNRRLKFALMWANHDWGHIQPARANRPPQMLMPGAVSRAGWERLTDHIVERYLWRPNYLTLDGKPYFSIYDLQTFIDGIGGLLAAQAALARFRDKVRAAGFPDLHLNGIVWGHHTTVGASGALIAPGSGSGSTGGDGSPVGPAGHGGQGSSLASMPRLIEKALALGVASIGSYTWIHHQGPEWNEFPLASYARAAQRYTQWHERCARLPVDYHPNVSMGWDSSPRTSPADTYEPRGYPWLPVLDGNTPAAFKAALERIKAALGYTTSSRQALVTINAWNEWTEGSYLLPDTTYGKAYLAAIRDVFRPTTKASSTAPSPTSVSSPR